jgi:hypothetical protein
LKFTTELETNPVPVTIRVNPAPPTVAPFGLREMTVGAGLFTVNVEFPDAPPPGVGLVTFTLNVPDVARSAVVIAADT